MPFAAITFNWEIDKKDKDNKANQKEPHSPCDPSFADQLLGGYMKIESGGGMTAKRRSPLSVSAMRPLHPLLGGIESPTEDITFDRTSHPDRHIVKVYWSDGKKRGDELTKEELDEWLVSKRRTLPNRAFIQEQARTFSLMETVAIAISDDANQIAYAIRGELKDNVEKPSAIPVIDETTYADIFITPIAKSYIAGSVGSADALIKAEQKLIEQMSAFDYENQL